MASHGAAASTGSAAPGRRAAPTSTGAQAAVMTQRPGPAAAARQQPGPSRVHHDRDQVRAVPVRTGQGDTLDGAAHRRGEQRQVPGRGQPAAPAQRPVGPVVPARPGLAGLRSAFSAHPPRRRPPDRSAQIRQQRRQVRLGRQFRPGVPAAAGVRGAEARVSG
jgi:hypothetical protein